MALNCRHTLLVIIIWLFFDSSTCLEVSSIEENNIWSSNYAPYPVLCPSTTLIRKAEKGLGSEEKTYMKHRSQLIESSIVNLLSQKKIPNFNVTDFCLRKSKPIKIALALSGGGYRSMLTGGGVLEAYDLRTPNADKNFGGVLQSLSYIGGISGGSWLVMSNFINDFKPVFVLKGDSKSWPLQDQLLEGIPSFDQSSLEQQMNDFDFKESKELIMERKKGFIEQIKKIFSFGESDVSKKPKLFKHDEVMVNNYESINHEIESKLSKRLKKGTYDGTYNPSNRTSLVTKLILSIFSKEEEPVTNMSLKNQTQEISWKDVFTYYKELHIEVRGKKSAGFYLSFTDYWGRALARRIFPSAARAPGATITASTNNLKSFKNYEQPFPIICAIEKRPNHSDSSKTSHLFEFTPFEFGSWDSYLSAFIPLKFLGSSLVDGKSIHKTSNANVSICVSGFDNIGFITGTSSSLFNHIFVYLYEKLLNVKSDATLAIERILKSFGLSSSFKSLKFPQLHPDYALYSPNPFFGYIKAQKELRESPHVYLVDGGDDGQNIPFHPFLVESRQVDIILAFDMTADILNYPNGTSLESSSRRYHNPQPEFRLPSFVWTATNKISISRQAFTKSIDSGSYSTKYVKSSFPNVPSVDEIMTKGLNTRPFFLGCDLEKDFPIINSTKNQIANMSKITNFPPVIVYTANTKLSYPSNTSTFQLSYNQDEVFGMVENGYNLATYKNSTFYRVCLNCAILKREFDRILLGMNPNYKDNEFSIPSTCQRCYKEFCWSENLIVANRSDMHL